MLWFNNVNGVGEWHMSYEILGGGGTYHLTESVYKVVWQKSIPAQIRQLILHSSHDKG